MTEWRKEKEVKKDKKKEEKIKKNKLVHCLLFLGLFPTIQPTTHKNN